MSEQRGWFEILKWKVIATVIIGAGLFFGSGMLGFPLIFQLMFVGYALLGLVAFVMLDMPPLPQLSGAKALLSLVAFYAVVSVVFTGAGKALPQFDPEWEKGKIHKILEAKKAAKSQVTTAELSQQTERLNERAEALLGRVAKLEEIVTGKVSVTADDIRVASAATGAAANLDPVAYGKEVYDLYECYNCHKIGGKGSTKKRGPILDNLGNITTAADLKKKIFEPMTFMAEGFEKEFKKKLMPKNYPELMSEQELEALVTYLMTLKNPSVETPKMVPQ